MAEGELLLLGLSHRTAAAATRERFELGAAEQAGRLRELAALPCEEALLLSTCDRLEAAVIAADPEAAAGALAARLADWLSLSPQGFAEEARCYRGEAAARHLFAVAASLESQVVGEPQVLGQLKAAHRLAREAGCLGARLEALLQAAYAAAKRVRRETAIGERPVGILASAREVARDLFGDLDRVSGLLLGLGEMGELLLGTFIAAGLGRAVVMHPSEARARAAAARLGCDHLARAELERALVGADLVISAAGGGNYLLARDDVAVALKARRRRPIFFIDAGLPRDIEPAVGELDGAFLFDLRDLEQVAEKGREGRATASEAASRILEEELAAFRQREAERAAVPALVRLRQRLEGLRAELLEEARGSDPEELTRRLVNRLLHEPSEALKKAAAEDPEAAAALEELLNRLFGLEHLRRKDDT